MNATMTLSPIYAAIQNALNRVCFFVHEMLKYDMRQDAAAARMYL